MGAYVAFAGIDLKRHKYPAFGRRQCYHHRIREDLVRAFLQEFTSDAWGWGAARYSDLETDANFKELNKSSRVPCSDDQRISDNSRLGEASNVPQLYYARESGVKFNANDFTVTERPQDLRPTAQESSNRLFSKALPMVALARRSLPRRLRCAAENDMSC